MGGDGWFDVKCRWMEDGGCLGWCRVSTTLSIPALSHQQVNSKSVCGEDGEVTGGWKGGRDIMRA